MITNSKLTRPFRASITIGSEFEGKFGDNDVKGVTVLSGDKGWRKFGENDMEMDGDAIANEKRRIYLHGDPDHPRAR